MHIVGPFFVLSRDCHGKPNYTCIRAMARDPTVPIAHEQDDVLVLTSTFTELILLARGFLHWFGIRQAEILLIVAYLQRSDISSFGASILKYQLRCMNWTMLRPIARPSWVAYDPFLFREDPQLYSWRYWSCWKKLLRQMSFVTQSIMDNTSFCYHCATPTRTTCATCTYVALCADCAWVHMECSRCQFANPNVPLPAAPAPIESALL